MRSIRRLARIVPVATALVLAGFQAACVSGAACSPCASMRGGSDWDLYASVLRGDNPCPNCACPAPCEPCAPPPCAPPAPCATPAPCAPPPCASPCQSALPPDLPPAAQPG